MKIYAVQLDITWREKQKNFAKVETLLQSSHVEPGSLVVLPEMFATGFDVQAEGIAEGAGQGLVETAQYLSRLAIEKKCTVVGSGIAYAPSGKRQNLAIVFNEVGAPLGSYQKMHPFTFGGEHKKFEAGEELLLFPAGPFQVSPFICYDLRFPEVFRHAAILGAQILTVSANWPSPRHEHWLALLRARAIENQCYVVGVNRAGRDHVMEYLGQSVVFGPKGEELALAGKEECVLCVEANWESLTQWRSSFPVLQDVKRKWLGLGEQSVNL